jgi:hypothetical protein
VFNVGAAVTVSVTETVFGELEAPVELIEIVPV